MAVPLVLKGSLALGVVTPADVSAECTGFTIKASRDTVSVPATLAGPKSSRAGGAQYELTIDYLADDSSATATLFGLLWTAIGSADGLLLFEGAISDGAVSATNPLWTGTIVVTEASLGGSAEALVSGSVTCPMTGAPVREVA